jgi:hypothetical protein
VHCQQKVYLPAAMDNIPKPQCKLKLHAYTAITPIPIPMVSLHAYVTDSKIVLVDNCCNTSITDAIGNFIHPPKPTHANIEG